MHGFIFLQLKKYIQQKHGTDAWPQLVRLAQVSQAHYSATEVYPDADITKLISAACRQWNANSDELLEEMGTFLVPDLLDIYNIYLKPDWRTLDLVEHTQNAMHRAVKVATPEANPPTLHVTRINPHRLIIDYYSRRKMASLAVGIIKGIAEYFQESDRISIELDTYSDGDRIQIEVQYLAN
ncbi:heme NO-binding domain-containing protein [Pontibacter sp. JH31]|uniref:Heme NO-binding domain-containing protein n=1 Tax=Pontibacter aquaedesilientis TaxID=2766980 RepID=A0ABR7XL59_9BACT|nr:heme NO-binding domain-containing protein [Pontibacter aquaedesilientis]MBD1399029.1 heme NO-binding domain-containing protein [Pontibacter aquaedesilientis]